VAWIAIKALAGVGQDELEEWPRSFLDVVQDVGLPLGR